MTPGAGPFFDPRTIMWITFGRGPLDEATYQISKTWAFWFQTRRFFCFSVKKSIFSSYDLDVQWTGTIGTTLKEDQSKIIPMKFDQNSISGLGGDLFKKLFTDACRDTWIGSMTKCGHKKLTLSLCDRWAKKQYFLVEITPYLELWGTTTYQFHEFIQNPYLFW